MFQAFERQRQVRPALGGHERMDLVHDDRLDAAQCVTRPRGEQQEQRLGRRDQDVCGLALEPRAVARRRIARADAHRRHDVAVAACGGDARDAGNRRAQVALDVDCQGLDRRDVEHAAPRVCRRHRRRTSRGRGTTRKPRASSRCPWARTRASTRRAQWPASPAPEAASARRMPRRTTARRRGGRAFRVILVRAWCLVCPVLSAVPRARCRVRGAGCEVLGAVSGLEDHRARHSEVVRELAMTPAPEALGYHRGSACTASRD